MKKNSLATTIAYVAVFTALVIVLAFVSIPIGSAGVPIVLQNAALILAGLISVSYTHLTLPTIYSV